MYHCSAIQRQRCSLLGGVQEHALPEKNVFRPEKFCILGPQNWLFLNSEHKFSIISVPNVAFLRGDCKSRLLKRAG